MAEAVVFALFASYFFSRTIIPTLVMFLLPKEVAQKEPGPKAAHSGTGSLACMRRESSTASSRCSYRYTGLLTQCLEHRKLFAGLFLLLLRRQSCR